jgi:hypothetical protein
MTRPAASLDLLRLFQALAAFQIEDSKGEEGNRYQNKGNISHQSSPTEPKSSIRMLKKQ